MGNKQQYRKLCEIEKSIPLYSRDWWLDAVCGIDNWDVLIVENDNKIVAALPYYMKTKWGLRYITQPILTQSNGIWMKYPDGQKNSSKLSYEKKIMTEVIKKIDSLKIDYFNQNFHYNVSNWLPFYWNGFTQTTRYTYVLDDISDIDMLYENFDQAKRKNIKKARQIVEIKFDLSVEEFYENHVLTLKKQGEKISYSLEVFSNLVNSSYQRNNGKTIYAIDEQGNIHAALFVVWDDESAYDLISTIDPEYRNSGAASLLVYEIIKYLKDKVKKFDFEGSMIENVENSFRQFGSVQKPYFNIRKIYSTRMKIINALKKV